PFVLETAEQAAHQAGIEAEIVTDLGNVLPPMPDRIEYASCAQRPPAPEERGIERADSGGDGTVEAADAGDGVEHISDFSQIYATVNPVPNRGISIRRQFCRNQAGGKMGRTTNLRTSNEVCESPVGGDLEDANQARGDLWVQPGSDDCRE